MKTIKTKSEKETIAYATKLAHGLAGGEIIGLLGPLGAGKTVFAKALGAALGVKKNITSPTFVIMKVYQINNSLKKIKQFVHIDAYRAKSEVDIIAIGADEYFNKKDTVVVVEWADKIKKTLPKNVIIYKINN